MKISSLDELKTKVGHVIVMILLVKMFERSKMVTISTGMDLLSYSVCIFLSSASLYILSNLHKSEQKFLTYDAYNVIKNIFGVYFTKRNKNIFLRMNSIYRPEFVDNL